MNLIARKIIALVYSLFGKSSKPKSSREIALKYFREHPEARRGLILKGLQFDKPKEAPKTPHQFTSVAPWGTCVYCQVKREESQSDVCSDAKTAKEISEIIKLEEVKYFDLLNKNTVLVQTKYSDVSKLTGEILSRLHHTHGCDPTMVEDILCIQLPESLHDEYLSNYQRHGQTGRGGLNKPVIKVSV